MARGISVNGLAIPNDYPTLDRYYRRNGIGGFDASVMLVIRYVGQRPDAGR